jgi:hypothetical protein
VSGGGTLKVESGTAISIGGKLLETDGVLKEGESAQADLLLAEDYEVKVGEILPVDYNYSVNIANPGETIGPAGIDRNGQITPAIDWIPPWNGVAYRLIGSLGSIYVNGPGDMQLDNGAKISHIPAGTRIGFPFSGNPFFPGYVVPADVFPNGLPIVPSIKTVKAGNVSPVDMTVPSGTLISAGVKLPRSALVKRNTQIHASLLSLVSPLRCHCAPWGRRHRGTALDVTGQFTVSQTFHPPRQPAPIRHPCSNSGRRRSIWKIRWTVCSLSAAARA